MKVLHIVKTSDGASWAAIQASELVRRGIEIHAVLPSSEGSVVPLWKTGGASLYFHNLSVPVTRPWELPGLLDRIRGLVSNIKPDLIHSHHVTTTLSVRLALGKNHPIPRVFQVPGPLHLEHAFYRTLEIGTAGINDYWIGTSRFTNSFYENAGVPREHVFLSYYGQQTALFARKRTNVLRNRFAIKPHEIVIGNMNWIYPPKYHLGMTVGIKRHEDVIDALGLVMKERSDVVGMLVGGTYGKRRGYELKLRERAERVGGGRIHMPGHLPMEVVQKAWPDFDLAVHVPTSENCGGVIEPLMAGVPVIGSNVGGIPEVIFPGKTGLLVRPGRPRELATTILRVLENYDEFKSMARNGQQLIGHMWDLRRTSAEVAAIYSSILDSRIPRPREFDSVEFLNRVILSEVAPAGTSQAF